MSSPPDTSELSDNETDPGYRSRSRSQSRRARRRKQQSAQKKPQQSMAPVPEDQDAPQANGGGAAAGSQAQTQSGGAAAGSQAQANSGGQDAAETKRTALAQRALDEMSPAQQVEAMGMQAFEWIGPDETSMDGPVTYAKAQRGEIAPRRGNPGQSLATGTGDKGGDKDPMDQDGLKLRLELNIDVEIELKAKIKGDLTLALLYVALCGPFVLACATSLCSPGFVSARYPGPRTSKLRVQIIRA